MITGRFSRRHLLGCCGLALGTSPVIGGSLLASALYDTGDIQETHITVPVRGLSSAFDGLIITQISDLHMQAFGDIERRLLSMLQRYPQQLIAITGDFADNSQGVSVALRLVKSLHAEYGIWATPGNIDYYSGRYNRRRRPPIFDLLRQAGVHLLLNAHAPAVQRGRETLYLIGVDDPVYHYADLEDALQDLPSDAPRILLAHSPDIIKDATAHQVALALVGHTHGGQIRLPLLPSLIAHSAACSTYSAGMYQVGPTQLYVNRGIGTSHIPLRFACAPEITYIRLVAA